MASMTTRRFAVPPRIVISRGGGLPETVTAVDASTGEPWPCCTVTAWHGHMQPGCAPRYDVTLQVRSVLPDAPPHYHAFNNVELVLVDRRATPPAEGVCNA